MACLDDELIQRNPCRIKGAGTTKSAERTFLNIGEVFALADAVALIYQHLVNGRDRAIADHVDEQIRRAQGGEPSGT